jgi:hypothetical protein
MDDLTREELATIAMPFATWCVEANSMYLNERLELLAPILKKVGLRPLIQAGMLRLVATEPCRHCGR